MATTSSVFTGGVDFLSEVFFCELQPRSSNPTQIVVVVINWKCRFVIFEVESISGSFRQSTRNVDKKGVDLFGGLGGESELLLDKRKIPRLQE